MRLNRDGGRTHGERGIDGNAATHFKDDARLLVGLKALSGDAEVIGADGETGKGIDTGFVAYGCVLYLGGSIGGRDSRVGDYGPGRIAYRALNVACTGDLRVDRDGEEKGGQETENG